MNRCLSFVEWYTNVVPKMSLTFLHIDQFANFIEIPFQTLPRKHACVALVHVQRLARSRRALAAFMLDSLSLRHKSGDGYVRTTERFATLAMTQSFATYSGKAQFSEIFPFESRERFSGGGLVMNELNRVRYFCIVLRI